MPTRPGLVETAHGGTLLLDEIGEMAPPMQVKLLRFLADGSYQLVGARDMRHADVRIVAATHRDLAAAVADGSFREDLYYRLKGVVLRIPSLAERPGDIALLASLFMRRSGGDGAHWGPGAMAWMAARRWPGNVREVRAAVECAVALAPRGAAGVLIGVDDLAFAVGEVPEAAPDTQAPPSDVTLEQEVAALERRRITEALARTGHNHTHTARALGLSRVGLLKKMDRMGLR